MQRIDSLRTVAAEFDAIVFDQWGVLHNGTNPYPEAVETIRALHAAEHRLAVLSNSGKRADLNRARIADMGFPAQMFEQVMTSGEALWQDIRQGHLAWVTSVRPITAAADDAENWRGDLPLVLSDDADAILLMGLADISDHEDTIALLKQACVDGKPLLCSNPDRSSPRADGKTVLSPGALAHDYADAGGDVIFYGKPHAAIFDAVARTMNITDPSRILMVGDSPEHDIAGARAAGWKSVFVQGGLHADHFGDPIDLFHEHPTPDFIIPTLR